MQCPLKTKLNSLSWQYTCIWYKLVLYARETGDMFTTLTNCDTMNVNSHIVDQTLPQNKLTNCTIS